MDKHNKFWGKSIADPIIKKQQNENVLHNKLSVTVFYDHSGPAFWLIADSE